MKLSAGQVLPFAPWIAPRASVAGVQDVAAESAMSVIRAAGDAATCDWFNQPIDHKNASSHIWQQLYCVNPQWWAGPGSPVVLMTPGENPITSAVDSARGYTYLDNTTMTGALAQALGAAVVVLEHRYFGGSSPYDGFDAETLQYLTMEQSAADIVSFAQNVTFSFDKNKTSPWVYWGAGYSATLGSWIEHFHPGVFRAYYLSGATVEANTENWYYYDTIRKGIDAFRNSTDCTDALSDAVAYVDSFLLASPVNDTKVSALKQLFGATYPIADDDFAYAIATPFRYWQETGGYKDLLDMCDAVVGTNDTIEDKVLGTVPASVVNYSAYFRMNFRDSTCTYFDVWGQDDPLWCLNTHDLLNPFFEARTLGNPWRTWYWLLCNEPLASWATAAPPSRRSLVSRKIDAPYWQRQCDMHFPPTNGFKYGSSEGRTPDTLNEETGGWGRNSSWVIWTSGEFDPWRDTGMSSELRPGGPLQSSDKVAVFLIKNAEHADDAYTARGLANLNLSANPEVTKVQQQSIDIIKKWVSQSLGGKSGE
ncbi:1ecd5953-aef9-4d56-9d1e-01720dce280a [Thermothielavioides terrestris]|uniref:1ecd5953-aef9-4d56-9d1e-01720dce280a n=1 Tax=Thermothielavioides terrestris TaxID=2587410 RepID=A0A3S4B0P0_9PEZI|nr:1ecd5953-aef9-4d56-9d1e-01720dce280a [Thermothielavioides terrestris]